MSAKGSRQRRPSSRRSKSERRRRSVEPGQQASGQGFELQSFQVGAVPLVNWLLERMRLEEILREQLPEDDPRTELPTACALLALVRNVLLSRQPVYGVGVFRD